MKRIFALILAVALLLCSCSFKGNEGVLPVETEAEDNSEIIGKWIDVETEQIVEYTASGFYYEYINENFTTDKTRYVLENGKIYFDCEPCKEIRFISDCHPTRIFRNEDGQITHAEADIDPENYKYIRAYVIDNDGKQAWTNPIFFED